MPILDPDDARALTTENLVVDAEVDLSGLAAGAALDWLAAALGAHRAVGRGRVLVRFEPARPGGGETLFQPVGRFLRAEIAAGRAIRAMPTAEGMWIVRLHEDPRPASEAI